MLNEELLRGLTAEKGCGYRIHTVGETGSTNDELKKLAANGVPEGYVLAADRQSAGRGRMGHSFFSPESGVYLSLLLRPDTPAGETLHLTAAAGVAVCHAIEGLTEYEAKIKWVNDVYISGKKVCGILTESSIVGSRTAWAVIGIGVNISEPEEGFPDEIRSRAGALFTGGGAPEHFRERFIAELLKSLEDQIALEWKDTLSEYRQRSYLTGREVVLSDGGKALVTDISDDGGLTVRLPDGSFETIGSQFSVREY